MAAPVLNYPGSLGAKPAPSDSLSPGKSMHEARKEGEARLKF